MGSTCVTLKVDMVFVFCTLRPQEQLQPLEDELLILHAIKTSALLSWVLSTEPPAVALTPVLLAESGL